MATVKCPSCSRQLEVEDAYRDWTVRCPHCGNEFVPDDVREAEARSDDRSPRRRREEDEEYPDDRDDELEGVPAAVREEALRVVSAPATWLEICGWVSALGAIALTVGFLLLAAEIANNPQANGDPAGMFVFFGCCAGILGAPYGIVMAIGARKMRNLSNRGWAMAGAILGVASFSLFGLFGLIQAGIGAWALVSLDKEPVRRAFGLPPRHRPSRRRDWDD